MNLKVTCDPDIWREEILSYRRWHFFYLPDWYYVFDTVIKKSYLAYTEEGFYFPFQIVGIPGIKVKLYSAPWGGYGGVFGEEVDHESVAHILENISKKIHVKKVYITLSPDRVEEVEYYSDFNPKMEEVFTYVVPLISTTANSEMLGEARKRNIGKARKAGLVVERREDDEAIRTYYSMYLDSLRRWRAKRRFSLTDFRKLLSSSFANLFLVRDEVDYLSGAIILSSKEELFYWHGAGYERFFYRRPNDLLHWEIIRYGIERGFKRYNMGTTQGIEGLKRFKKDFGAVPKKVMNLIIER